MRTHDSTDAAIPVASQPAPLWKRLLPLAVLGGGLATIYGLGLHQYLSFDQLRLHRGELMTYVATMPVTAVLLFIAAYAVTTARSLPGGIVLTLTGGFLLGTFVAAVLLQESLERGDLLGFFVTGETIGLGPGDEGIGALEENGPAAVEAGADEVAVGIAG